MTGPNEAITAGAEPSDGAPQQKSIQRNRRVVLEWTLIIVVAVLASFLVRTFVFQTFYIPSSSMNPTLWKGDRIVVNKLSVEFGTINIGDILVFKAPPDVAKDCSDKVTDLVKRVIGLPGDRLYSKGNTIYVNGKKLDQKWSVWRTIGVPITPTTVPAGHYFMMGDWHSMSCDSRTWGTVPRSDLIGKVFVRIWPLKSIKWF
jgi:signal peptidase I